MRRTLSVAALVVAVVGLGWTGTAGAAASRSLERGDAVHAAPTLAAPASPASPVSPVSVRTYLATLTAAKATPSPAPGYRGLWGGYVPDFPGSLATLDSLQSEVGRSAHFVMWYVHWAGPYNTPNAGDIASVEANGSTPVITWLSDDPTGATTITDRAIANGTYDRYISGWARALRQVGSTVYLRLDPEMNGNWYGWSPGQNGQSSSDYVAAWRHVHSLFAAAGALNVKFMWSPDVDYTGATNMASLYPGDQYVDFVGLDGYNWGPLDGHTWQTPQQVFGPSLSELAAITSKPELITEVGSTEVGGDKATWITQFFALLKAQPQVRGFIWFDDNKETDWRIDSSPASLQAFRLGLTGTD